MHNNVHKWICYIFQGKNQNKIECNEWGQSNSEIRHKKDTHTIPTIYYNMYIIPISIHNKNSVLTIIVTKGEICHYLGFFNLFIW